MQFVSRKLVVMFTRDLCLSQDRWYLKCAVVGVQNGGLIFYFFILFYFILFFLLVSRDMSVYSVMRYVIFSN